MRIIALEEHYATTQFLNGPGSWHRSRPEIAEALADIGETRIKTMDDAGIDLAVLSLAAPGVEQLDGSAAVRGARDCNDALAAAVDRYPGRFAGFAALPISEPRAAADELQRTIDNGFVGAEINGHCRGVYLDDPHFEPILERAAALQAPIYLHPTIPPPAVVESCYAGFSQEVTLALSTVGWGWHTNTGTHVLRLILGGVFDRHPDLQFIIGHMGEALPFMMPRFETTLKPELTGLRRPVGDYLRENLSYTFANFINTATFANLVANVGVERVMFSTDHPFGAMRAGREFLDNLPLSAADRAAISHGNAERVLRL